MEKQKDLFMTEKITLIDGGIHKDERGKISFVNSFDFHDVKRFYLIQNSSIDIIRAWQGHKIETKYFYVISGSFLVCGVKIDDWKHPSENLPVEKYILLEDKSQILKIPSGYANGIKALQEESKLLIFSTSSLEESKNDDYRFDKNLWRNWNEGIRI